jgi:hypothetical protein
MGRNVPFNYSAIPIVPNSNTEGHGYEETDEVGLAVHATSEGLLCLPSFRYIR